jgi:hypothetical protein
MLKLPQEIIDYIIAKLDYPSELGSCALVSRAFRPQAQRLLFSHVVLDDDCPNSLADLAQILAQNSTLGRYVQSAGLWLNGRASIGGEGMASDKSELAKVVCDLETTLRACHIRQLTIYTARFTKDNIRILSGENLPYLKVFGAAYAALRPAAAMRTVLSRLPPLDQLELRLAHLFTSEDATSLEHGPIQVKRLHLNASVLPSQDLPCLALADLCIGIKELKLLSLREESTKLVNQVLESCGAELEQFHLHVDMVRGLLRKSSRLLFHQMH